MNPDRFTIDIPIDHPAFEGHFPGHPILPGVVLLAEVLAGIERRLGRQLDDVRIKVAKFHAPVAPGARLAVELADAGGSPLTVANGIAFTVSCAGTRVASGTLAMSGPPSAEGGVAP